MADSTGIFLSSSDDSYVAFADTPSSRIYKKQILRPGESFLHPANKTQRITITPEFGRKLVENFKAGKSIVQFPMVNERNQHVESPDMNLGEVIDLTYDDENGVVAYIDVRRNAEYIGKTFLGASAMMSLDYQDNATGEKIGPTLLHVAATNRPYLNGLKNYEPVSLSQSDDNLTETYIFLSEDERDSGSESDADEGESAMDKLEDLLKALKDDFDIDVEALQNAQKEAVEADTEEEKAKADEKVEDAKAEVEEDKKEAKEEAKTETKEPVAASAEDSDLDELIAKLSEVLKSADSDLVSLSDSEVTVSDVANGVIQLSANYSTMKNTVDSLNRKSAEADVDDAVRVGKILPAQRDAMVELKLSNSDMYDRLLPENAIVALSDEKGISVNDMGSAGKAVDGLQADIERISAQLNNRK